MSKTLVAYFSASGVTRRVAENLAAAADADLYEIRPELADKDADIAAYDRIFLGFPIWWYTAPAIIKTFLESYDFAGKTIVLFATSGGSGLGKTAKDLEGCCPGAVIREGKLLNGNPSREALKEWAAQMA